MKKILSFLLAILLIFAVPNQMDVVQADKFELGPAHEAKNVLDDKYDGSKRIFGENRYSTAAAISQALFEKQSTVILACGNNFADALAGSSLSAGKYPILLTGPDKLSPETEREIKRLQAEKVVILGGQNAISTEIEEGLKASYKTLRIFGKDRYETAAEISKFLGSKSHMLASGKIFPDALSGSGLALIKGQTILLSEKDQTNKALSNFFYQTTISLDFVGGPNVLSEKLEENLLNISKAQTSTRYFGEDRYETALAIAKEIGKSKKIETVVIASGENFPDALTASVLLKELKGVLLLTPKNNLRQDIIDFLYDKRLDISNIVFVGGKEAISQKVANTLSKAILDEGKKPLVETVEEKNEKGQVREDSDQAFTSKVTGVYDKTEGKKLFDLPQGSYIEVKKNLRDGWIEFSHYGKKAYIKSENTETFLQERGWVNKGQFKYFIGQDGRAVKGWLKTDKGCYYFDPMMAYAYAGGPKNTGRYVYYFDNEGLVKSGKKTIYGTNMSQVINFVEPSEKELNNSFISNDERDYLGQAVVNTAMQAIGTKFTWYGTDLKKGVYCSGLAYRAYQDNGLTIPGPEFGNETDAKKQGSQSGDKSRGYGPAGDYGYKMVTSQYNLTDDYTGGIQFNPESNFSNCMPGDLLFARRPDRSYLDASHTFIYAGILDGVNFTIHAGFAGCKLEPISTITNVWRYPLRPVGQRPFAY